MLLLLDAQAQSVSPEQATTWLRENMFEGQRKRRPAHTEFLRSEMAAGRFRAGTVIEFGVLSGKGHLVNGQHTLAAIEAFGAPISLVVVRQQVDTEEELAKLYNTHDLGLGRTLADAYQALNLKERYSMTDQEINALSRAAPFIAGNFGLRSVKEASSNKSRDFRVGIMEAYHTAARVYYDCLKVAEPAIRKALMQPAALALGTFTVAHDQERALRFWSLAADDQNLAKLDPPKAATVLIQRAATGRGGIRGSVALAQSLIATWNSFVLERPVKGPRLMKQASDIVRVLRTPLEDDAVLPDLDPPPEDVSQEDLDRLDAALGVGAEMPPPVPHATSGATV